MNAYDMILNYLTLNGVLTFLPTAPNEKGKPRVQAVWGACIGEGADASFALRDLAKKLVINNPHSDTSNTLVRFWWKLKEYQK